MVICTSPIPIGPIILTPVTVVQYCTEPYRLGALHPILLQREGRDGGYSDAPAVKAGLQMAGR